MKTKKETEFGKFTWENESLQKKTVFNAYRKGEFNSTNLISNCSKLLEVLEQFLCLNLITNNKEQEFNQDFLLENNKQKIITHYATTRNNRKTKRNIQLPLYL